MSHDTRSFSTPGLLTIVMSVQVFFVTLHLVIVHQCVIYQRPKVKAKLLVSRQYVATQLLVYYNYYHKFFLIIKYYQGQQGYVWCQGQISHNLIVMRIINPNLNSKINPNLNPNLNSNSNPMSLILLIIRKKTCGYILSRVKFISLVGRNLPEIVAILLYLFDL